VGYRGNYRVNALYSALGIPTPFRVKPPDNVTLAFDHKAGLITGFRIEQASGGSDGRPQFGRFVRGAYKGKGISIKMSISARKAGKTAV